MSVQTRRRIDWVLLTVALIVAAFLTWQFFVNVGSIVDVLVTWHQPVTQPVHPVDIIVS